MDLQSIVEEAKQHLLQEGHHPPTLHVQGDQAEAAFVLHPFPAERAGQVIVAWLAGLAVALATPVGQIKQVYFVAEAWIELGRPRPGQSRQREGEALGISSLQVETDQRDLAVYEILRHQGDTIDLVRRDAGKFAMYVDLVDVFVDGYTKGFADL